MTATEIRSSKEVLDAVLERGEKFRELRDMPESKRGDSWAAEKEAARRDLLDHDAEYDLVVKIEERAMRELDWLNATTNPPAPESRGPWAAFADISPDEFRSAGDQFVRAMGDGETIARRNMISEDDGIEVRNLLTGSSASTPAAGLFTPLGSPQFYGSPRQTRLFVRDLISVQQTNLGSIPYIRELNAATNETGATSVAEASAKPEVTMEFAGFDAPVRKIAAWLQATEEILEDAPTVRGYIDTRLAYMLMLREEKQVIGVGAGGGNAPNIKGILDFSGVQTDSGEFYVGVGTSRGKIEAVDGDPDGVVAHPTDFWAAVTDRHATFFDGNAFGGGGNAPFAGPAPTAWGLPVVRSRSMTAGTALVGAFRLGATLFERKGVTIRTTDSHASLFVSNTWIILAEERVALAVHRPDFFSLLTVTAPS